MSVKFPGGAVLPATLAERELFVHTPDGEVPKLYTGPSGGGAPVPVPGAGVNVSTLRFDLSYGTIAGLSGPTGWDVTISNAGGGEITVTPPVGIDILALIPSSGIDSSAGAVVAIAIGPGISYQTSAGVFDLDNADEVPVVVVALHT